MSSTEKLLARMRNNPKGMRYGDVYKVCEAFFGAPRQSGSSHAVFKTPWPGDPRVNLQNSHGQAKPYQVRQALLAIDRLLATAAEDNMHPPKSLNEPTQ